MTGMPRVSKRWWPRQRACIAVLIPVFVAAFAFSRSLPAQDASTSSATARQSVRDRLERAAAGSRELFNRAPPEGSTYFAGVVALIREDDAGLRRARFSPLKDVREYWRLRPWETAYRSANDAPVPVLPTEDWPTPADAPALRELLTHPSPAVRGLAVEALGALGLPEDVKKIGHLLTDTAMAGPGLARTAQRSSTGLSRTGDEAEDELLPMVWSDRTVGAYARAAVLRMTGRRFDGMDAEGVSFPEWIEMHDLGAESLWYWQQRITRERSATPALNPLPGEAFYAFQARRQQAAAAHQAQLRKGVLAELERLPPDAQAKVFLLTAAGDGYGSTGPVNPLFPEGFTLRIGRERILELLDGRKIWRDCLDLPAVKRTLLWRLARLAPTLLPVRDWAHVREELETRFPSQLGTTILASQLRPAAGTEQAARVQTPPTQQAGLAAPASARQAVRVRLEGAVVRTRELFERAPGTGGRRVSSLEDVREFWRVRPWEKLYRVGLSGLMAPFATEDWPTRGEAAALRDLMKDPNPDIRGMAVDALGALALPEDIRRIAALMTDAAPAVPGLGRPAERGPVHFGSVENAATPTAWTDRTVASYARAAAELMLGGTYGFNSEFSLSFSSWTETRELGWESLGYWERRLARERNALPVIVLPPGQLPSQYLRDRTLTADQHRAGLRKQSASDLVDMTAEARAKIHLLTDANVDWAKVTGPINPLFPEGFTLAIGRDRILELLEGRNIWPDRIESIAESVLLWRLGRLAPSVLPATDWPRVREELVTRASHQPGMPVLVSRLLPVANPGQADDPGTREGYLRASLVRAVGDRRLQLITGEMIRTNVEMQWPFLAARFNPDPEVGFVERLGVLDGLVEAPHSREKLTALVAFVEDPRNVGFFTQRVGQATAYPLERLSQGLYTIAGPARADLPSDLRNVGQELVGLQRLARALLGQKRDAR